MSVFKMALAKEKDYSCPFQREGEWEGVSLNQNRPHHLINLAPGGIPHDVEAPSPVGTETPQFVAQQSCIQCVLHM